MNTSLVPLRNIIISVVIVHHSILLSLCLFSSSPTPSKPKTMKVQTVQLNTKRVQNTQENQIAQIIPPQKKELPISQSVPHPKKSEPPPKEKAKTLAPATQKPLKNK